LFNLLTEDVLKLLSEDVLQNKCIGFKEVH
jgi:hypothetical protein